MRTPRTISGHGAPALTNPFLVEPRAAPTCSPRLRYAENRIRSRGAPEAEAGQRGPRRLARLCPGSPASSRAPGGYSVPEGLSRGEPSGAPKPRPLLT